MPATIEIYKNKGGRMFPTIKIVSDGPKAAAFPFSMGITKCKLVLAHLSEIRNFVEEFKDYKPPERPIKPPLRSRQAKPQPVPAPAPVTDPAPSGDDALVLE